MLQHTYAELCGLRYTFCSTQQLDFQFCTWQVLALISALVHCRDEARQMFLFGYDQYLQHAFPKVTAGTVAVQAISDVACIWLYKPFCAASRS